MIDAARKALRVRREEVVANELYPGAEPFGEELPAFPVLFVKTVLDRHHRKVIRPRFDHADHRLARKVEVFACQAVESVRSLQRRGGDVDGDRDICARQQAGAFDGLDQELQCCTAGLASRAQAALVGEQRRQAALARHLGCGSAHSSKQVDGRVDRRRTHRHGKEILHVHVAACVQATAQDVGHRQRQRRPRLGEFGDAFVQRLSARRSRCTADGERDGQRGVGAETLQLRRAVELTQAIVEMSLIDTVRAA